MTTARIALVSGGNRGIGYEVCRQLARLGMTVLLGARNPDQGREAAARLTADGVPVEPVALDVADPASVAACVDTALAAHGRIDALVNNAGINYDTWHSASGADLAQVRETFDVNLFGAWRLAQAVLPAMRRQGWGRVVNVSSESGSLALMTGIAPGYSASKAAMNALTRALGGELAGTGILVNAVCPGWTATEMGGSGGRPVERGAASVVWAVTLPDGGPTGGFFRDGRPLPW